MCEGLSIWGLDIFLQEDIVLATKVVKEEHACNKLFDMKMARSSFLEVLFKFEGQPDHEENGLQRKF